MSPIPSGDLNSGRTPQRGPFPIPGAGRLVFAGIAKESRQADGMDPRRAKDSRMCLAVSGRIGSPIPLRLTVAALALAAVLPGTAARAQYVDGPAYGAPSSGYEEPGYERGYRRPPPRRERAPVGFNCDAVQQGITGPKPFSCPLPGPRPLGVRCFCDLPIASFSPPQTAVGRVVP